MVQYIKDKKEDRWNKNNKEVSMEHSFRIWDKKMTYLCVDIRDYYGYAKM